MQVVAIKSIYSEGTQKEQKPEKLKSVVRITPHPQLHEFQGERIYCRVSRKKHQISREHISVSLS